MRIAVGLSSALGQLHKRSLIHKDLKPSNVLVDTATGDAWLTGFGIASRLPRERQSPEAPEFIAGTLPYMAPEQIGRLNRSIDLCALGPYRCRCFLSDNLRARTDIMHLNRDRR